MGYSTDFIGRVEVLPPLNAVEQAYLTRFASTRRMQLREGPYFVDQPGDFGQGDGPNVIDHNEPPDGQPSLWCSWVPLDAGRAIGWNGSEKFYEAAHWMQYLIDHFLAPDALASKCGQPQFAGFTFDHQCRGIIVASGESAPDLWKIAVAQNRVRTSRYPVDAPCLGPLWPQWDDVIFNHRKNPSAMVDWFTKTLDHAQVAALSELLGDLARIFPEDQCARLNGLLAGHST